MNKTENKSVDVCLIKQLTNIPCPSCGSTRSVISLSKGDFKDAFEINPIGYIVAFIMLISPLWIIADIKLNSNSLFNCYQNIENHLKKLKYSIPLILLVMINWIWNIKKGL
jgi:hypothetical protein